MTLNPFVFGTVSEPKCFDESSPCKLEQTSMCVIHDTTNADKANAFPGQSKYVPWLICMDSGGDNVDACDSQVGVDTSAVNQCLDGTEAKTLLQQYLPIDQPIHATPTVHVNGQQVKTSYSAIRNALCSADPSLKGCSAPMPNGADEEVPVQRVPRHNVVV